MNKDIGKHIGKSKTPPVNRINSVQFSRSVLSSSLRPHESQHTRPPCPSPTPGVHSDSCPSSQWYHPAISSSVVPFSSCPQSLPSIRVFSNESTLRMRWPNCWSFSFSISPSNEYSGLISLGLTGIISLLSKGLSRVFSSTTVQSINSLVFSLLYGPTLTSIHNYW